MSRRSKFLHGSAVGCIGLAGWAAVAGLWRANTGEVTVPAGNSRSNGQQVLQSQITTTLRREPVMYPTHSIIRPNDLLDNPSSYLGREITVTIVEPLASPDGACAMRAEDFRWRGALRQQQFGFRSRCRCKTAERLQMLWRAQPLTEKGPEPLWSGRAM